MDHDILAEKILKAMGGKVPIPLREEWSKFRRTPGSEIRIDMDWIKDQRFHQWVYENRWKINVFGNSYWYHLSIDESAK